MIFGFGGRWPPPVIRPLRGDKAEACARLHAAGFAHPWSAEEIERLIAEPSTLSAAALDAGAGILRGFALARRAADEAEILTVAVEFGMAGPGRRPRAAAGHSAAGGQRRGAGDVSRGR